jgi:sodium transport system permease protein
MSNFFLVLKKELKRFFTDRRMLISLILPGLIIFVMYSLLGDFFIKQLTPTAETEYIVATTNVSEEMKKLPGLDQYKITYQDTTSSLDEIKADLKEKKIDLYINYVSTDENHPYYEIYSNSVNTKSSTLYQVMQGIFYSNSITNIEYAYSINPDVNKTYDIATQEDESKMFITMILPFIMIIFLFSGCMAIATESIAGEKERGTIATLLVTPVKRGQLALGKIVGLSITAMVSAASSFLGLIFSLPKLMGGSGVSMVQYGFGTYLAIFAVLIVTVLLFTVLLSIVSCFAKSVKEASQYALPVMVLVMLVGITSMIGSINTSNPLLYLVPGLNSVLCMKNVFGNTFLTLPFVLTIISNVVFVGLGIYILTKMFNNEKIMFSK